MPCVLRTDGKLMNRPKRLVTAFAALMVLAGVLPVCIPGLCCDTSDAPAMHAQMPCCAGETSMTPREPVRVQPATFAAFASNPLHAMAPVVVVQPAAISFTPDATSSSHHEPSPPLFLLNAQFLI